MGSIDIETKLYFKNRDRFADLFNFKLYDGRQQIHPENLKPFDSNEVIGLYENQTKHLVQRFRDNVSVCASMQDDHSAYMILGIESQTNIDYAMPVRNMVYDSINYADQIKQAADSYRKKKKEQSERVRLSGTEFLSGFRKEDRLVPVITIVVLFNADQWDGPRSLHDMLSIHDRSLFKYIPDYRINLIAPADLQENEYKKFRTPLGQVLEYIRVSRDKEKLTRLLQEDPRFGRLERDTANLINVITDSNLPYSEDEGEIDMCKAIEDMRADAKAEGRLEGKSEATLAHLKTVMNRLHLSLEEAMDFLEIDPQIRQGYAAKVK